MPGIERYLGVRAAISPVYSRAKGRWYFLMNLTDTFQVYAVSAPGAWPDLITDFPERVAAVHAAPDQAGLVIARDRGGNEHHQLYWLDLHTMEVLALTDNPDAVHLFGAFSPDGRSLAYTSTARNGQDYDVYIMAIDDPTSARLALTRQGHWDVCDWTDAGDLILEESRSNADQSLYRWTMDTDRVSAVTPSDQMAQYQAPATTPQGGLYALTDYGRDYLGIAHIGASDQITMVRAPDADIDSLAVAKTGDWIAYSVNLEGFSELHLYHLETQVDRIMPLGDVVIFGLTFDHDGIDLAVTHSGAQQNMNISLVSVETTNVRQLTFAPMIGLQSTNLIPPEVFRYQSFDHLNIPGLVYRPKASGPRPVVISVHGGPEAQERPSFSGWYQYLLAQGYALVTPNVRGSTGYGKAYSHLDDRNRRMDSVRDIEALVAWIRQDPDLDAERIAIYGGSYGGFMVLSSITQYPELFQAAIDIVGIANLETFLETTSPWRRAMREAEYGYLATDREFLRKSSPIHQVDRIRAPLFVVHGANDPRVPLSEAEQITSALRQLNRPVKLRVFADEGHGIAKLKNRLLLYPEMVAFLDEHLHVQRRSDGVIK